MRLSYLIYALTLIVWSAMHLGLDWPMSVVWIMLIVATVIYILEGLALGVPAVNLRRTRTE
jgi:hypothetical protein